MAGILGRWLQLGRRYLWPHLLFGMVAAGLGQPAFGASTQPSPAPEAAASSSGPVPLYLQSVALLPEGNRRTSLPIDYWHQHAIRTVIRHLNFTISLPELRNTAPLRVQQDVLLSRLSALLTLESKPPVIIRCLQQRAALIPLSFAVSVWLGRVQGIRAGPQSLS